MAISRTVSLLMLSLATLAGCATKNYGQLPPVEGATAPADCGQVAARLEELQRFRKNIDQQSKFGSADVVAFLLDFGIGNAMAKNTAVKSAELASAELRKKADDLNCPAEESRHVAAPVRNVESTAR